MRIKLRSALKSRFLTPFPNQNIRIERISSKMSYQNQGQPQYNQQYQPQQQQVAFPLPTRRSLPLFVLLLTPLHTSNRDTILLRDLLRLISNRVNTNNNVSLLLSYLYAFQVYKTTKVKRGCGNYASCQEHKLGLEITAYISVTLHTL